jgi:hypothetical protein
MRGRHAQSACRPWLRHVQQGALSVDPSMRRGLLALALAAGVLCGCGATSAGVSRAIHPGEAQTGGPHQGQHREAVFRIVVEERAPIVVNSGSPRGFVMVRTVLRTILVTSSSAAIIRERRLGRGSFPSPADRQQWRASGSPPFGARSGVTQVAAGGFSFLPIAGPPLTLREAERLSPSPNAVRSVVLTHLSAPRSAITAAVLLREYGFLLGWAPLPERTRRAVQPQYMKPGGYNCALARTLALR